MMKHYRLFFMSTRYGHIERAENLVARNDAEAVDTARALSGSQPMELWCDTRKVYRFETPSTVWVQRCLARETVNLQPAAE